MWKTLQFQKGQNHKKRLRNSRLQVIHGRLLTLRMRTDKDSNALVIRAPQDGAVPDQIADSFQAY